MCGRYAIFGPASRSNREAIAFLDREIEFEPTWNAAPTQMLPVYRVTSRGETRLEPMRWGLVPHWARDPGIGAKMINARADTIAEMPAFRTAFARRRCLVPMSGFYEWRKAGAAKIPHFIHLLNAGVFAVAGLYEFWRGKESADPIRSFTVVTTDANELVAGLHERMPAIIPESDYAAWLDPQNEDAVALKSVLRPFPADEMRAYPVSPQVNGANNNGPGLITPAPAGGTRELEL